MNQHNVATCRDCGAPLPIPDVTRCYPCLETFLGPLSEQQVVQERETLKTEIARKTALVAALQALYEYREQGGEEV